MSEKCFLTKNITGEDMPVIGEKNLLHNHGKEQRFGVSEAEPLLVRQHGQKFSVACKSSPKSGKKGSHTENRSKEENSKGMWYQGESQHLQSSHKFVRYKACGTMDYSSGQNQASSEYALHLEKDSKIKEAAFNQKLMEEKKINQDICIKSKRHPDVFEAYRVEKDLLLKFLQDLDVGGENFHQASKKKAKLTKSGSFPLTTQMRNINPSTSEHKQNEIWAFPQGEKLVAGSQGQKMFASSFAKDIFYVKPMPLECDLGVNKAIKQKPSFSSSRSSHSYGSKHKGWNQLVLHRFKVINQKIKHALMEFKNSGYQTSVEAFSHSASSEYSIANNEKLVSQRLDDGVYQENTKNRSSDKTKASNNYSNKHEGQLIRRASSINESLDGYTQLFEQSFSKDIKWRSSMSKSLKLANKDKNKMGGRDLKFSRRNLSLPNLEPIGLALREELCHTNNRGVTPDTDIHIRRKSVSLPLNEDISLDHIAEAEMQETVESSGGDMKASPLSGKIVEKIDEEGNSDHRKDTHEPAVEDGSFTQEKVDISMTICPSKEAMATLETSCEDCQTSNEEGRELNTRGCCMDELETDLPNGGSSYCWPGSLCNINASAAAKGTKIKSHTDNDSSFKYVVNEVLLEIYETSPTYFTRHFFNSFLRQMQKGHYLLNEAWSRVNSYLSLRPEQDQTLDDVAGRDLAKGGGWMNLLQEKECVALELEMMIVNKTY